MSVRFRLESVGSSPCPVLKERMCGMSEKKKKPKDWKKPEKFQGDALALTFEEIKAHESGTVYIDERENGVRYMIMRGPGALCAYIGVPIDHPLSGKDYDDLNLDCHGGLTFSSEGDNEGAFPGGYWWYGWDYAHCNDKLFYDDIGSGEDHAWTVSGIAKEVWSVTYDFAKLIKLAEGIKKDSSNAN